MTSWIAIAAPRHARQAFTLEHETRTLDKRLHLTTHAADSVADAMLARIKQPMRLGLRRTVIFDVPICILGAMAANTEQSEYWNTSAGEAWVRQQDRMDVQLAPLGGAAMTALGVKRGERVLDVGCGAGTTTAALAQLGARATGTDISAPLLARARERYRDCEFVLADAQTYAFAGFDAVFSRFGVMFFDDPVAAFANLARAVAPTGRIAFVCWRPLPDNPLFTAPLAAAVAAGIPMPAPTDPDAPGPFAFADRDRVARILGDAGWRDVTIAPRDLAIGGNPLADTVELALQIGPLGRLLREHPEARDRAVDAVREELARHVTDGKVMMTSATWIVTAHL